MFEVNIYIETTIKGPNRGNGMYGYVVEFNRRSGSVTRAAFSVAGAVTANQITLIALNNALDILTKPCWIIVYTDSSYLLNTINQKRLNKWLSKNWINAKGKVVKNKSLWQMVYKHMDIHSIYVTDRKKHQYTEFLQSGIRDRRKKNGYK